MRCWLNRTATATMAMVAVATLWGCGDLAPPPYTQCTTDESCQTGLTCQFARCAAPGVNQLKLHLQITPRTSDGLLPQHVAEVDLARLGNSLDVTLVQSTIITGTVRFASGPLVSNVSGTLTARADGEIAGLPHVFTTKSTGGQGFKLSVLPGRDYRVTFRPSNKASPLHTFVWSAEETKADFETQIVLPDDDYIDVTGFARWDNEQGPLGATVAAYDAQGAKLSETTTVNWTGLFKMQLPPAMTQARFRIEAGDGEPMFPTTWTALADVSTTFALPVPPPQEPRALQLGVLGLAAETGETSIVAGATLSFELAGTAQRATAQTDDFGSSSIALLPGQYWVLITPPEGSPFAASVEQLYVDGGDEPLSLTVELAERPLLEGTVTDATGSPVSGTMAATRRPDEGTTDHSLALSTKPIQIPLVDGVFAHPVDRGMYDLRYVPLETAQAPPQWLLGHHTDQGAAKLELQPAGVFAVVLRSPDGQPLSDAQVRAYMGTPGVGTREFSSEFSDGAGAVALPVPFEP